MQQEHGGNGCSKITSIYTCSIDETGRISYYAVVYVVLEVVYFVLEHTKSDYYEIDDLVDNVPYDGCNKNTEAADVSRLVCILVFSRNEPLAQ